MGSAKYNKDGLRKELLHMEKEGAGPDAKLELEQAIAVVEEQARLNVASKESILSSLRQQLVVANSQLRDLQEELRVFKAEIRHVNMESEDLAWKVTTLKRDIASHRHLLAFRVGGAIIKNLSIKSFWRIPFSLVQAYQHYRRDKPKHEGRELAFAQQLEERKKQERRRLVLEERGWPSPMRSAILWQAQRLEEANGVEDACEFIKKYGGVSTQFSGHLMECNRTDQSDEFWLEHLNAYLKQFDIAPVCLKQGSEPKLLRLHAQAQTRAYSTEQGPTVTVIMPAFNAAGTIRTAVSSILEQTWQSIELIIVDDRSSDETLQIAQEMAQADSRIKVLSNPINVGPYVSKNRGLKVATGQWVTGHDADDWAHPQRIELQLKTMLENPELKASIAHMIRIDEAGRFSHFSKIGKTSPDGVLRVASISCFFAASLLREKLGYWDSIRFGGDSEMIERARKILGANFRETQIMSMICLDAAGSLTNDPLHGVSKVTGISPTRQYYRDQWTAWHRDLDEDDSYLELIQEHRKFDAPLEALVSNADVRAVMACDT